MALFEFADYTQYDGEERLTRLQKHITEVSQHVLGTTARSKSVTAVPPDYLNQLKLEEQQLINRRDTRNFARNVVQFGRGDR